MKEIITIHLGGTGISTANSFWELQCRENGIDYSSRKFTKSLLAKGNDGSTLSTFFSEKIGGYTPRAIFGDLGDTAIECIKSFDMKNLFDNNFMYCSNSESSIWPQAYYSIGRELTESSMFPGIKQQLEACESHQGFLIFGSSCGGSGSGLASLLVERIKEVYSSTNIIGIHTFPSVGITGNSCEIYNTVLSLGRFCQNEDVVVYMDNQSLYESYTKQFKKSSNYKDINSLIAQLSTFFLFNYSQQFVDLTTTKELVVNKNNATNIVIPYFCNVTNTLQGALQALDLKNFFAGVGDKGDIFKAHLNFKGLSTPKSKADLKEFSQIKEEMEKKYSIFNDFSASFNPRAVDTQGDCITSIVNTNAIRLPLKRILNQFQMIFKRKYWLHWYTAEGMDEMEFTECQNLLAELIEKYQ